MCRKHGHNTADIFFEKVAVPQVPNEQKVAVNLRPILPKVAVMLRLLLAKLQPVAAEFVRK